MLYFLYFIFVSCTSTAKKNITLLEDSDIFMNTYNNMQKKKFKFIIFTVEFQKNTDGTATLNFIIDTSPSPGSSKKGKGETSPSTDIITENKAGFTSYLLSKDLTDKFLAKMNDLKPEKWKELLDFTKKADISIVLEHDEVVSLFDILKEYHGLKGKDTSPTVKSKL